MNWNELEVIWRRQGVTVTSTDVAEIKKSFEQRRRTSQANLLIRNLAEGGTGLVMTAVMGSLWVHYGRAAWPLGITAALLFGVASVFIVDQIRIWRKRLGPEATLLAKVEADLGELHHQRRLIQTWPWWYLFPCLVALVSGIFTLSHLNFGKAPPGFLTEILSTPSTLAWIIALTVVVGVALWRVRRDQRKSIVEQIEPRIAELEILRSSMLRTDGRDNR